MGIVKGITATEFPKQSGYLNCATLVCFDYDTSQLIGGVVVRDDAEEPGVMIIRLNDGRYVLSTECQYKLPRSPDKKDSEG